MIKTFDNLLITKTNHKRFYVVVTTRSRVVEEQANEPHLIS